MAPAGEDELEMDRNVPSYHTEPDLEETKLEEPIEAPELELLQDPSVNPPLQNNRNPAVDPPLQNNQHPATDFHLRRSTRDRRPPSYLQDYKRP